MKVVIIGDVHGLIRGYQNIINNCDFSICVGDFGFKKEWDWLQSHFGGSNHYINPGNHDYGPVLQYQTNQSCGNFAYFDQFDIFTVRGAESIDKHLRIDGIDWFRNEELNYREQLEAFDKYCEIKPKVVISHDCPQSVLESIFKMGWSYGKTQTRTMLEMMFQEHQPELWIFGHHHTSKDEIVNGTRFICLDELETFDIEL